MVARAEQRPLLRGYFHLGAAIASGVGLIGLLLLAHSPRAYVGGSVFALSLVLLYSVSATYHTVRWGRRMSAVLKRLDHSMIFVMIAGGYTPFCLIVLRGAWGINLLAVVWSLAAAGIALKVAGRTRRAGSVSASTWRRAGSHWSPSGSSRAGSR